VKEYALDIETADQTVHLTRTRTRVGEKVVIDQRKLHCLTIKTQTFITVVTIRVSRLAIRCLELLSEAQIGNVTPI
jgi:hypothetical protein